MSRWGLSRTERGCLMPATLKSEERDALFLQLSVDLGLLGDLQMAMSEGNEEECYKLGRRVGTLCAS